MTGIDSGLTLPKSFISTNYILSSVAHKNKKKMHVLFSINVRNKQAFLLCKIYCQEILLKQRNPQTQISLLSLRCLF